MDATERDMNPQKKIQLLTPNSRGDILILATLVGRESTYFGENHQKPSNFA